MITYRKNIFSENGEDGIIDKIFTEIIPESKLCCEFGAWDGIWASNCRNLIVNHDWKAVMIEGDTNRYQDLLKTYSDNNKVRCLNKYVDSDKNSLNSLLEDEEKDNLDFLSIDIDGLDYEIFQSLEFYPKVICIEVNTCHSPESYKINPKHVAKNNVGQPLPLFVNIANSIGYELVCFTGNAFFIKKELLAKANLKPISAKEAYLQHLSLIPNHVREHLLFVNKGILSPYYKYKNPYLTKSGLGLNYFEILKKYVSIYKNQLKHNYKLIKNILKYKLKGSK